MTEDDHRIARLLVAAKLKVFCRRGKEKEETMSILKSRLSVSSGIVSLHSILNMSKIY